MAKEQATKRETKYVVASLVRQYCDACEKMQPCVGVSEYKVQCCKCGAEFWLSAQNGRQA